MMFFEKLAPIILDLVLAIISLSLSAVVLPWVKDTLIPLLEEKRLMGICKKFVEAAEKLAESGIITSSEKKSYVVRLLVKRGIVVTDEVEAFIESAVKELDMSLMDGFGHIADAFEVSAVDYTHPEELHQEVGRDV